MNQMLGTKGGLVSENNPESTRDNDPVRITNGLYKLLISRQRLPNFKAKMARLFAKGKARLHEDLDVVN